MTPRARYRETPAYYGATGAAAAVVLTAYAPGRPWAAGRRAAMAQAARRGAAVAAGLRRPHHAPPYPVPVATWCGRAWPPAPWPAGGAA